MVVVAARLYAAWHVLSLATATDCASRRLGFIDCACLLFDSSRPDLFRLKAHRPRLPQHFRVDGSLHSCIRLHPYYVRLDPLVSILSSRRRRETGHGTPLLTPPLPDGDVSTPAAG